MPRTKTRLENGNGATLGFEAKLWQAADKLRNNMDAADVIGRSWRLPPSLETQINALGDRE
jgi:hypothetical protein